MLLFSQTPIEEINIYCYCLIRFINGIQTTEYLVTRSINELREWIEDEETNNNYIGDKNLSDKELLELDVVKTYKFVEKKK